MAQIRKPVKDLDDSRQSQIFDNKLALTAGEVGQALGLSANAIYIMVNRGQIPYVKLGHRVRFIREEILAWLKQGAAHVSR